MPLIVRIDDVAEDRHDEKLRNDILCITNSLHIPRHGFVAMDVRT